MTNPTDHTNHAQPGTMQTVEPQKPAVSQFPTLLGKDRAEHRNTQTQNSK